MNESKLGDLLQEIGRIEKAQPKGFTTQEVADATGRTIAWTRTQLGAAVRAGRVRCSGWRQTFRMDGKPARTPVYLVVRGKGAAK